MVSTGKLATVFGASGFVGRHVVRELAESGYRVRAACRRPDLAGHLQPLGGVGQIQPVQANLRYQWSVDRAVEGADVVVNLVGIMAESGEQSFDAVQARGARSVAEAAARAGAHMIAMSAIGADAGSDNDYARTKGEAEQAVFDAVPEAHVLRPSLVFGPEDKFFNRFANMARLTPAMPLIGGGHTRFQPVYVGDVAAMVARAAKGKVDGGKIYEMGGPEVLTFRECMEIMLDVIERKPLMLSLPFPIASLMGSILQYAPGAPLTPGQVDLMRNDNVVSDQAIAEGRILQAAGIRPTTLDLVLPQYMVRFRKHGQFEAKRGL